MIKIQNKNLPPAMMIELLHGRWAIV